MNALLLPALGLTGAIALFAVASKGGTAAAPVVPFDDRKANPAWLRREDDLEYLNPLFGTGKKAKGKHRSPPAGVRHSQRRRRR